MSDVPFYSVIMASYNSDEYIEESIKSVLNQTFNDWELIIVDDASIDNSYKISEMYAKIDRRIKVFRLDKNYGAAYARNFGFSKASARWLAILDSDDLFLPAKLEIQHSKLISKVASTENIVLLGTGVREINERRRNLGEYIYNSDSVGLKNNLYSMKKFPPHSSIVYSAQAIAEVGGFNDNFSRAEDYDLWLRLSKVGGFACLENLLVEYRVHESNISTVKTSRGISQESYSYAANVCYRLRCDGHEDPSQNAFEFNKMLHQIESSFVAAEIYSILCFKVKFKSLFKMYSFFQLIKLAVSNLKFVLLIYFDRIGIININQLFISQFLEVYRAQKMFQYQNS